jgi:hypothetical protein
MSVRFVVIAGLTWSGGALAANVAVPTAKPVAALQQCRTISDTAARVACYDRAVDALTAATASNEVVIVERQEVRKVRKGLFGFSLPKVGFLTGQPGNAEDKADVAELQGVITASRSIGNGKWRFSVADGGTWETLETNMGFSEPLPGRKVLLEAGSLGAYFAKVEKGRRVQAKRVN